MTTQMKLKNRVAFSWLAVFCSFSLFAQSEDSILYKQVDTTALYIHVNYPPGFDTTKSYPAIVFFFGGGWNGGTPRHFEPQARYFAQRGMVCFRADYRVKSRQGTTPFESLKDAKSAIRFIREHAGELHVDPQKIVASGGSAGGHLAAATALVTGFNEGSDRLSYSCVPNALVLFNPAIDNGPGGLGYERIGEAFKDFSPIHNIREGALPTIFFLGTEDRLIPVETARYYQAVMEKVGSRCDLFLYEGQGHGFFNYGQFEYYKKTVSEANRFLVSMGYLAEEPLIEIE
jgi:acetyl esterase